MKEISVDQLMSKDIITVSPYDTLEVVSKIFVRKQIHHLPVVFENQLVGIISNTDVERAVQGKSLFINHNLDQHNQTLKEITLVTSIMTKDVTTIESNVDIKEAYAILKAKSYRSLVITEKGELVGILTPMDYLDFFFQQEIS